MSLFMKFKNIQSAFDTDGLKNWMHIDTCTFGISNSYKSALQDLYQKQLKPNVSSIEITREVDEATSQIIAAVANSEVGDCQIQYTNSANNEADPLISISLTNAQITDHGFRLSNDGKNQEHLSITFTKYKFNYTPISNENKQKAGNVFEGSTEHHEDIK